MRFELFAAILLDVTHHVAGPVIQPLLGANGIAFRSDSRVGPVLLHLPGIGVVLEVCSQRLEKLFSALAIIDPEPAVQRGGPGFEASSPHY